MINNDRVHVNPAMVYLGLGSNLGNREEALRSAIDRLGKIGRIISVSSIYETDPWGSAPGGKYLNLAAGIKTDLTPVELLSEILRIEEQMGRKRKNKWEPRIIDIDILFYDHMIIRDNNMSIPHPMIAERRFVLIPLGEIAGDFKHPVYGKTVKALLEDCEDDGMVTEWKVCSD